MSLSGPPAAGPTEHSLDADSKEREHRFRRRRAVFGTFAGLSLAGYVTHTVFFLSIKPSGADEGFARLDALAKGGIHFAGAHAFSGLSMMMVGGVGDADGGLESLQRSRPHKLAKPWLAPTFLAGGITAVVIGFFVGTVGLDGWRGNQFIGASVMAFGTATGTAGAYFVGRRQSVARNRQPSRVSVAPSVASGFGGLQLHGEF